MRRSLLVAATTTALVLVASCVDDAAGPRQPMAGQLAVVPNFGTLQGGIVAIARGRFVLTRIPGGTVAADTVIDIAPGADSVDLAIQVPILTPGETFNLTIALISTTGDTVFRGGPVEVSPSTSGTPVPVEVPFTYVGTGANAAAVQILSPDTTTFTGESVLLVAEARDSAAAAIPNTPIGWTSLDTARVRVTADPQYRGVAVGGSQRGTARLVATLVTGQTDTVLVSNQPLPTTIAAESGNNQSALADSTLPQPLVARVTAGDGQGAAGLWVRFAVTTGAGTLSTDSALTDAAGRASVQFTIARSFQPHVITATTARLAGGSAVFNATLLFAPPATLEILAGDGQTATAGSAVAIAPQVRVLDADGLPIPGVTVTFSVTGGGGIVAGGTPITDTLGLATVTSWTLGGTAGPNALRAAVGGLTTTFSATGIAGAATRLVLVSGDAQTDTAGATLPLPLVARAEDANGNPVAGATVDWVAGAGGLNTATTVTDAGGLGQVTWTLGPLAGAQSVTATLNGTTATVGFSATATAGTAARLAFTVEPTDVAVNSIITPAVTVTASDGFGNVATGYTGSVQVSLLTNPGGGTLGGTTTRAAAAGVATFPDLSLNAFANGYALLATATGLTPDTSATFNVLGPAGQALWINPAGGNWSNPANWLGGVVPTASDTAFITIGGTYTVNVDAAVTVPRFYLGGTGSSPTLAVTSSVLTVTDSAFVETGATLSQTGAQVTGAGTVVVRGTFNWLGGTQSGTGQTVIAGTGALSLQSSTKVLDTRTLELAGTGTWTGGGLSGSNGAILRILTGGLLDVQANLQLANGGGAAPTLDIEGTLRRSAGTGTFFLDWPLIDVGR
ncbi:MAG: Ig-like domain-containing protein, partial [Gemmatimonadota bacterium]|nr:Ig-like domain-containing protein [Gemmatimonadota bacterium]